MNVLTIVLRVGYRLGGIPRYKLGQKGDSPMQIPDQIRKCVVFVCCKTGKGMELAGTAFFVSMPLEATQRRFVYLVTAKHVIDGISRRSIDQKVHLRLNLSQGQADFVGTPIEGWMFHSQEPNADVAILAWAPPQGVYDCLFVPHDMAATEEVIQAEEIGVGDDVFLTGLFPNHHGLQHNIPIIRIGNIASMPEEKVHTESLGDIDAYLVEARSIGGLSGSPVFVVMGHTRKVGNSVIMGRRGPPFYWLGLMHGHFDLSKLEIDDLVEDSLTSLQINMGIAIVIPVWKILEVMNQEVFAKAREVAIQEERKKTLPIAEVADTSFAKEASESSLDRVSQRKPSPEKEQSET